VIAERSKKGADIPGQVEFLDRIGGAGGLVISAADPAQNADTNDRDPQYVFHDLPAYA
jgi:hypothetical protein